MLYLAELNSYEPKFLLAIDDRFFRVKSRQNYDDYELAVDC